MEPTEKVYGLQLEHEPELIEMLGKKGYHFIEQKYSYSHSLLIFDKNGAVAGETYVSIISAFITTPEGRTLDELLAEWNPEQNEDKTDVGGEA